MSKVVTFGELLLRLSTERHLRFSQAENFEANYGGSEANIAISLACFGIDTDFITRLPNNELSATAISSLKSHDVGTNHIIMGGERLGIYFLETGASLRASKVIYDRAYSSISEIEIGMIDWDSIFHDVDLFHWSGITPAISQNAADVCLEAVKIAHEKGISISTDMNYRSKLWNYGKTPAEIMTPLIAYSDIMFGNEKDAKLHFSIVPLKEDTGLEHEAFLSTADQMMNKFPKLKKIIKTVRGSINASYNTLQGVIYDGKELHTTITHEITHIVDRVGGGDAFTAGALYGLLNDNYDNKKTIDFATAAACLKHTIHGDLNLTTIEEVENMIAGNDGGTVSR